MEGVTIAVASPSPARRTFTDSTSSSHVSFLPFLHPRTLPCIPPPFFTPHKRSSDATTIPRIPLLFHTNYHTQNHIHHTHRFLPHPLIVSHNFPQHLSAPTSHHNALQLTTLHRTALYYKSLTSWYSPHILHYSIPNPNAAHHNIAHPITLQDSLRVLVSPSQSPPSPTQPAHLLPNP